jgi:hypothetical protein
MHSLKDRSWKLRLLWQRHMHDFVNVCVHSNPVSNPLTGELKVDQFPTSRVNGDHSSQQVRLILPLFVEALI